MPTLPCVRDWMSAKASFGWKRRPRCGPPFCLGASLSSQRSRRSWIAWDPGLTHEQPWVEMLGRIQTRVWTFDVGNGVLPMIEARSLDRVVLLAQSHALALA